MLRAVAAVVLAGMMAGCGDIDPDSIVSSADGGVISDMPARGGMKVRTQSDLEELAARAWGDGGLGLHRGHGAVENVLEAFLGIRHDEMHALMDRGQNLASICEMFGFAPDNLVETLTASFAPFIEEAAQNGVISAQEVPLWRERIHAAFHKRVHWQG